MKVYEEGNSIAWRGKKDDKNRFGKVLDSVEVDGELTGYMVLEDGDRFGAMVPLSIVVDFEEISRLASEALDRWHAEDRRKADLLSELLGKLGYYARQHGVIAYDNEFGSGYNSVKVQDLVDEYLAKRDNAPD